MKKFQKNRNRKLEKIEKIDKKEKKVCKKGLTSEKEIYKAKENTVDSQIIKMVFQNKYQSLHLW